MDQHFVLYAMPPLLLFIAIYLTLRRKYYFDLTLKDNQIIKLDALLIESQQKCEKISKEVSDLLAKQKLRPDSYEVIELIHDLTSGKGLIEIKRVDPTSFFIRSPRDQ